MKWTYIINQKIKTALALLTVLLLVLATNLLDKQHFSELQKSFTSIYEDRLVAENYLFNLSKQMQLKKQLLNNHESFQSQSNHIINDSIDIIIKKYEATKLTTEEAEYFFSLKNQLQELKMMEKTLAISANQQDQHVNNIVQKIQFIWSDLEALSQIQLTEGKRIIENSQQIISFSNLTSRLEIVILIVIGLIIQALVFSSKTLVSNFKQRSDLN